MCKVPEARKRERREGGRELQHLVGAGKEEESGLRVGKVGAGRKQQEAADEATGGEQGPGRESRGWDLGQYREV